MTYDLSAIQRDFTRYVAVNTRSDASKTAQVPSTPGQTALAELLVDQLHEMGLADARLNPADGFVTATLPGTALGPVIGWIAHLDTADFAAADVHPQFHPDYRGAPIRWANGLSLTTAEFPALSRFFGQTLVTTDGTTLLGADDKAGIAGAMAAVRVLLANPDLPRGPIRLAFGPDEEIGVGADRFDVAGIGADFAYTLDNGALGQIEDETFNAAEAVVTIRGRAVHPGEAYGLLVNAITLGERLDAALPADDRPEHSRGHSGFFMLDGFTGSAASATLTYLIRDFATAGFAGRKKQLATAVAALNAQLDEPRLTLTMHDQYHNPKPVLDHDPTPLRLAEAAIRRAGLTPTYEPFRGGTDGSKLTARGLPTPNLFNGGLNFHGPYECVSLEAIAKLAEVLVNVATLSPTLA
ncbi:peptidase T [Lacticaseibacillus kribbianus]|uniref:peptidase T n=1 Tax=Lacticaseibacillus kribbianus TaxID=2926292 RepID=UPI001CD74DF3|nr:peptidase T [Lacticaseibacillus kribbianus]